MRVAAGALLALALAALGCASSVPAAGGCGVVPVSTAELPDELFLRARVALRAGEIQLNLETVAVRDDDSLVVIGLAPYGLGLFRLRQTGRQLALEGAASHELGPVPLWVADALHRIYWIEPPAGADVADWEREGERIRDRRQDGGLRREFTRLGAKADSEPIAIHYPGPQGPPVIEIRNPRCGYAASVVTLEQRRGAPEGESR